MTRLTFDKTDPWFSIILSLKCDHEKRCIVVMKIGKKLIRKIGIRWMGTGYLDDTLKKGGITILYYIILFSCMLEADHVAFHTL